jgi:hypothetical protein
VRRECGEECVGGRAGSGTRFGGRSVGTLHRTASRDQGYARHDEELQGLVQASLSKKAFRAFATFGAMTAAQ